MLKHTDILTRGGRPRPGWQHAVLAVCEKASHNHSRSLHGSMVSSYSNSYTAALDGGCSYFGGWGGGAKGWFVHGTRLRRYIYYKLGVQQPRRGKDETHIPTLEELEAEIVQRRLDAARKAERDEQLLQLMESIRAKNVEIARSMMRFFTGPELSQYVGNSHSTVLKVAIEQGVDLVADLLALGVDPNAGTTGNYHSAPIHAAASRGRLDIVHQLVDAGANSFTLAMNRETALMKACKEGHAEVAEYLLSLGLNPNYASDRWWSAPTLPLVVAAQRGDTPMVRVLLDGGADINARCSSCGTALHQAIEKKHDLLAELLRAWGGIARPGGYLPPDDFATSSL
jgi:hypothetical protein